MAKTKRKRPGRPRNAKINQSEAIRDEFKSRGIKTPPKDIIAALAAKGIDVTPALVSNVRARMLAKKKGGAKRGRGRVAKPRRGGQNGDLVSMAALADAKRLIEKTGGVAEARKALDAMAKLS